MKVLEMTKTEQVNLNRRIRGGKKVFIMVEGEECVISEFYFNGDGNKSYKLKGKKNFKLADEYTNIYFKSKEN